MGTEVLASSHFQFWEWAPGEQEAAKMGPDRSSPSQGRGDADTRACLSLLGAAPVGAGWLLGAAPGSRVVAWCGPWEQGGMCIWPPGVCGDTDSAGACAGLQRVVPTGAVGVESKWVWGSGRGLERLDSRGVSCPLLFLLAGLWGRHWRGGHLLHVEDPWQAWRSSVVLACSATLPWPHRAAPTLGLGSPLFKLF